MASPSSLAGQTALVTGGCGFIGSHLVRGLLQAGVRRVVVLDSFKHGDPNRLADLGPAVELVHFTLGLDAPEALEEVLRGTDYLLHLAAEKYRSEQTSPRPLLDSNVAGTLDLLTAAGRARVRKVVFSSSLYAYGRRHAPALQEDEIPRPDTVYGISKLAGEHLLRHMKKTTGIPYVVLRYFFVYGPGQYAGLGYRSVIVKNFEQLRRGQEATIYGDGRQVLDYVYVDDVVEATLLALQSTEEEGVLNIGSGEPTAIDDLVSLMIQTAGRDGKKTYLPPDETAGTWRVARIDRARDVLGWRPRMSLPEGLARTFAWTRESPP